MYLGSNYYLYDFFVCFMITFLFDKLKKNSTFRLPNLSYFNDTLQHMGQLLLFILHVLIIHI